jgi:hypothetical protein
MGSFGILMKPPDEPSSSKHSASKQIEFRPTVPLTLDGL